jgi:hypothetical protein
LLSGACAKACEVSKTNPKTTGAQAILLILLRPGKFWCKDKLFIFLRFRGVSPVSDGNARFILEHSLHIGHGPAILIESPIWGSCEASHAFAGHLRRRGEYGIKREIPCKEW